MLEELKRLFKHTAIYGAGNILNKAVGFLMIPFYTHYLTPADYGTLELLDLTTTLIALVLSVWMNAAIVRYYYEYEDSRERNRVISTALISAAVIGAVAALVGAAGARGLSGLVLRSPEHYPYIWLVLAAFFFSCLNGVSWSYLRARQRSAFIVCMDLFSLTLTLSLNIYFIAFLRVGMVGVLYSSVVSGFLITTALSAVTLREVKFGFDFGKLKAMAAFGFPLVFTNIAIFVLNFADRFFLQRYSTVSDVGIYALGYKFGFMLTFLIVQPFIAIWGARMYEIAKRGDAGRVFSRIFDYFSLAMLGAALGLSLLIREVISIIAAPDFHQAHRIVPLVALGYLFYGLARYFETAIYIEKRSGYIGAIGAASAAANLLLNYLLIPGYGAMGAAWATSLSFLFMAVLTYGFAQRVHPVPYRFSRLLIAVGLSIVIYLASTPVAGSILLVSAALKLLLLAAFPLALYLLGFFEREEVERIKAAAQPLLARYRAGAATFSGR